MPAPQSTDTDDKSRGKEKMLSVEVKGGVMRLDTDTGKMPSDISIKL
jgi:hypothetical protein